LGDAQFQPLKTFLTRDSKKFAAQKLARTYVIVTDSKVCAYATLVCGEIAAERDIADLDGADFRYEHFPAVKIARLAVHKKYRDFSLGRTLIEFSVGRSQDIADIAGCRFVVVDAKTPSVAFYEKCGFRLIDTAENRGRPEPVMFLDLNAL